MEQNQVLLTGVVGRVNELQRSPAGVARRVFYLEHRSRQVDAGEPREVVAHVRVVCAGEICRQVHDLKQGDRLSVSGFLSRAGYQENAREQLVINAQHIQFLT